MTVVITRDLIWEGPAADDRDRPATGVTIDRMPMYGMERAMGLDDTLPSAKQTVKFRLYDDDDELYYEGDLDDDDECVNQSAALRWGETMAGCAKIKVLRDGEYKFEIG